MDELEFVKKFRYFYFLRGLEDIKKIEENINTGDLGPFTKYYSTFLNCLKVILKIKWGYEELTLKQQQKVKKDLIKYCSQAIEEANVFSFLQNESSYLEEINNINCAYHFHLKLINNPDGVNKGYLNFIRTIRKNVDNEMIKNVEKSNIVVF